MIALAGASAACTNSARFSGLFTGSTENQRQIIGQSNYAADDSYQPLPPPVASAPVTSMPLAAPSASTSVQFASLQPNVDDSMVDRPGAYGWSAVGGQVVTVGRSESLDTLSIKYGVPQGQILAANQLASPADVRPGRIIVIPRRVSVADGSAMRPSYQPPAYEAPSYEAPAAPAPVAVASSRNSYMVEPGDTLYGISRKTGYSVRDIAAANGIETTAYVQTGQQLRLPGAAAAPATQHMAATTPTLGAPPKPLGTLTYRQGAGAPAATPVPSHVAMAPAKPKIQLKSPAETAESGQAIAMTDAPKVPASPRVPSVDDAGPTAGKTAAAVDTAAEAASADGESFRWPVRGRIISGFGSKPNGEKNDGINLAVPEGTSVKAVEAGTVIYAGNELEGYGNLVLVRHAGGWVSAYAHNKDLTVKRGDTVTRGEVIAHAGMTGSVTAPQVHFELRKGAKPVNPLDYLAGA